MGKGTGKDAEDTVIRTDETRRLPAPGSNRQPECPHLIGVGGAAAGLVYPLTRGELLIGRADEADIRLTSTSVSRRHALVRMTDTEISVEDLGSRNGTYVNTDKIIGRRVLRDGDHLAFGEVTLLKLSFEVEPSVSSKAPSCVRGITDLHAINRFYLLDRLRSEHAYACRHDTALTLVFFRIQDAIGEAAVRDIATLIRPSIRDEEVLVQTADAELIALVLSDANHAVAISEQIHARLSAAEQHATSRAASMTAVVVPLQVRSGVAAENILIAAYVHARKALEQGGGPTIQAPPLDRDAAAEHERSGDAQ